jgi:hypothetical protein
MSTQVCWPAERFYWAVIDSQGWRKAGPIPVGLLSFVAEALPVPVEQVHAVGLPLADTRLLVCAAPRADVEALNPDVLGLAPESMPDFAREVEASVVQLLVGEFEPRPIRRAINRRNTMAILTVIACTALTCIGLERRARVWIEQVEEREAAEAQMMAAVLPGLSPELLGLELQRVQEREESDELKPSKDASLAAMAFLKAWPSQVPSKPQGLSVSPQSVSVAVVVDSDPADFLRALSPPAGWRLEEPRINSTGNAWRLNLTLTALETHP